LNCIGWIPSADGHISFSLIGAGTAPKSYRYSATLLAENSREVRRWVTVFQKRKNMDRPWLFRIFSREARHYWLLLGESLPAKYYTDPGEPHEILDKQGMLRGQILFVPFQVNVPAEWASGPGVGDPKTDQRRQWKRIRRRLRQILRPDRPAEDGRVFAEVADQIASIREERIAMVLIEFALFRTGELRLWLSQSEILKVEQDNSYPKSDLYVGLYEIPPSHSLLRQAYYFLKDAVHHHVHHNGLSDQIIPPVFHPDDDSDPDLYGKPSLCEQRWHRETLWGLSRTIEELVRKGTRTTLRNALGFICFAESFQSTLAKHVRKNGFLNDFAPVSDFHLYDFKSLRESVRIALERDTWSLAGKAAMTGSIVAVLLSSIAAANVIANHPNTSIPNMWRGWLSDLLYNAPYAAPLTFTGAVGLAFMWIYSESTFLRTIFWPVHSWNRFIRSHIRYLMSIYKGSGRRFIAFVITLVAYTIPLGILSWLALVLWRLSIKA
jgi:hypothetical protein